MIKIFLVTIFSMLLFASPGFSQVSFQMIQDSIFTPSCALVGCHSGFNPTGNMNLEDGQAYNNIVNVPSVTNPSILRVNPGNADQSMIVMRVEGTITPQMPLGGNPISSNLMSDLRQWINEGAISDIKSHEPLVTESFTLAQNYPNPFNPSTIIAFSISSTTKNRSEVSIRLYDVTGKLVTTLLEKNLSAGQYHVSWDGKDRQGNEVAAGIYIYRMAAGNFTASRKMLLAK